MTHRRKSMKAIGAAQQPPGVKPRAQGTARGRRRQERARSDDYSALARTKFDGFNMPAGKPPLRVALERPPVLKDVDLSWFYATVERLMSYDDRQFCTVDPDDGAAQAILEFGTTCLHVAAWHRDVAKVYDALVARIAVRAARKVKEADDGV